MKFEFTGTLVDQTVQNLSAEPSRMLALVSDAGNLTLIVPGLSPNTLYMGCRVTVQIDIPGTTGETPQANQAG